MRARILLTFFIAALVSCIAKPAGPKTVFELEPIASDGKSIHALDLEAGAEILATRISNAAQIKPSWVTTEVDASAQRIKIIVPETAADMAGRVLSHITKAETGLVIREVHPENRRLVEQAAEDETVLGYQVFEHWDKIENPDGSFCSMTEVLENLEVEDSYPNFNERGWDIHVRLSRSDGKKMADFTQKHVGSQAAILANSKIVMAPLINEQFSTNFVISLNQAQEDAYLLSALFNSEAVPFGVRILSQSTLAE